MFRRRRSTVAPLATVALLLLIGRTAHLAAQDVTPPTVTFSPNGGVFGSASVSITIGWCDDQALNRFSKSVTLNGSSVTTSFNYVTGSQSGCGAYATSTGTISLNMGDNTLVASICDLSDNCGSNQTVFTRGTYAVWVTPDNQPVGVPVSSSTSYTFAIKNTGTIPATLSLTATCTGSVTGCSSPGTVYLVAGKDTSIAASFTTGAAGTTGTVKLKATVSGSTEKDSGWVNTTAQYLSVSTAFNTFQQGPMLCELNCFAATASVGTVPYFSFDQGRSVTLIYNGDQVAARPFVFADVHIQSGATGFVEYWLQAKDSNGVEFRFLNGDDTLRFVPSTTSQNVRLAGQFDAAARGYGTGAFPITIVVTAKYTSSLEIQSFATKFINLNERASPIARGWTVSGLQRLYSRSDGALITMGDGSAVFFMGCGSNCYMAPQGEFSTLSASGSGTGLTYTRSFPDSSQAIFNYLGRLAKVIGRLQDTVSFDYDANWRLTKVYDPLRTNGASTHLYTSLAYGTYGLTSIQEPGLFNSQTGGRSTTVTVAGDSTLTAFADPDNVSTRFVYDASRRLSKTINRRGDTTSFYYDTTTWKPDSVASPRFTNDSGNTLRLVTRYLPWQVIGMPRVSTGTVAATPALSDTLRGVVTAPGGHVTAFTINRRGQALKTTREVGSSIARVATVFRTDTRPDSIRHHEGGVDHYTYTGAYLTAQQLAGQSQKNFRIGAFGQPDSVWGTGFVTQRMYLGSRGRIDSVVSAGQSKTKYTYDTRQRVLTMKDPLSQTTSYHYESVFGNLDSTLAPGSRYVRHRFDGYGRDTASQRNMQPWSRTLYDALNRQTKTFHDSLSDTTTYTHDSLRLKQVRDAKGQIYTLAYNALGFATQNTDPTGAYDTFLYNSEGLQSKWINRRGDTVKTTYDALQRPVTVSGQKVVTSNVAYDSAGRTKVSWNANERDSVFLASSGWMDSIVTRFATNGSNRFRLYYKPGPVQLLDSINISGSGTPAVFAARRYVWNQTTQTLDTIRIDGTPLNQSYNAAFVVTGMGLPAGVSRTVNSTTTYKLYESTYSNPTINQLLWRGWRYDSLNRVSEAYANAVAPDKQRFVYSYDKLGRITQVVDSILANACLNFSTDYGYYWCDPNPSTLQARKTYHYDAVGNMDSVSDFTGTGAPTYTTGNRLTSWPGYTFGNDAAGNRIWQVSSSAPNDTTRYFWSASGLLDSVKVISGGSVSRRIQYDYNLAGLLARKRVNGSATNHLLWDRGQLIAELDSTFGRLGEYAYYPGADNPLAVMHGTTSVSATSYYQLDAQGNVWGFIDQSGSATQQALMAAWELESGSSPSDGSRLGWKALPFEGDATQFYYMRARWYDPRTKRFLTEDPIGLVGGINPFVVMNNDPVNGKDPSGLIPSECPNDQFCTTRTLDSPPTCIEQLGRSCTWPPTLDSLPTCIQQMGSSCGWAHLIGGDPQCGNLGKPWESAKSGSDAVFSTFPKAPSCISLTDALSCKDFFLVTSFVRPNSHVDAFIDRKVKLCGPVQIRRGASPLGSPSLAGCVDASSLVMPFDRARRNVIFCLGS